MSDQVQFDTDNPSAGSARYANGSFTSRVVLGQPQVPGMANWLMRHGIKSEQTAKYVILTLIVVLIAAAIFIYRFGTSPAITAGVAHINIRQITGR